jgi:mannose-1-phosphate guanylyltransferase
MWAVIPAGGSGTRLWPLSRTDRPKFLLNLLGTRSLLQQTCDRLVSLSTPDRTLVVCGPAHAAAIARQLPDLPEEHVIVEPVPRGSGPAIGLAAALIVREDPNAIMGSFAADHDVKDEAAFAAAIRTAIAAAEDGYLVTIGLTPTRPETGYGYIERTDEVASTCADGVAFRAAGFHEKPSEPVAAQYLAGGLHLWNASMFVWKAQTLLDEMAILQPELHAALVRIAAIWGLPEQEQTIADIWMSLPESTIDQGIMERSSRVTVVPAEMGWSDVGDWHGLGGLIATDSVGNSVRGDLVQVDSRDCVVWSETERVVALLGVDNVVVVDTPDALMVVDRSRAQEVRKIVDYIKTHQRHELS